MTIVTFLTVDLLVSLEREVKKYIAILLIVAFSSSTLCKLGIVANYYVNFKYYVEVLCENKDKPELACKGKCHLKKELKQTEKPSKGNIPEVVSKVQLSDYVLEEAEIYLSSPEDIYETIVKSWPMIRPNTLVGVKNAIFRPPTV